MVAVRDIPIEEPRRWLSVLTGMLNAASRAVAGVLSDLVPKGLYARALIIIIAPIVLLEGVVAFT
ncbi:MAG: hypothetical protein AB7O43_21325, partial [Hyphomicrobiaceae bacterium]